MTPIGLIQRGGFFYHLLPNGRLLHATKQDARKVGWNGEDVIWAVEEPGDEEFEVMLREQEQ